MDALMVCGGILSSAFLLYGGLLSLTELLRPTRQGAPGGFASRFAEGAKSRVDFGRKS